MDDPSWEKIYIFLEWVQKKLVWGGNQFSYSYPLTSKDDMDSKDDTKYKYEYSNTTSLGANVNSV